MKLICGHTVAFDDQADWLENPQGAVLVDQGRIIALGNATELRAQYPAAEVDDYGTAFVMPGFVDAHVHYPQLGVMASYGRELLDWLTDYTFPEEARFSSIEYCQAQATFFVDQMIQHGTTSAAVFATVHPQSAQALFEVAHQRGLRLMSGKVMMDRNCPDNLRDTAQSSYDQCRELIQAWHGRGRIEYALTPRFAPTSTPAQLDVCRALWDETPSVALQTHLSENTHEIQWVKQLFPGAPDYLGVYEQFDLVRRRCLLGHAVHLTPREMASAKERGAALVHCPTSNLFLGSGLFDFAALREQGQSIALASDVGGGTSLSMFATMKAAYQVSAMKGRSVDIAGLWYGATLGAARSIGWDQVGNLSPGFEADVIIIDPQATPILAQRFARADSLTEALFALAILGDDRAVQATYVAGSVQNSSQFS